MRVVHLDKKPFFGLSYESVDNRRRIVAEELPFLKAEVDALPRAIGAILAASDLQGRELRSRARGEPRLLGEVLAEVAQELGESGLLPPMDRVGVVLAGDLYSRPKLDRRGGSGDCRGVWRAFRDGPFRWVVGVAGNHDFGGDQRSPAFRAFKKEPGIHILDGETVELDGLTIAGLSGIIGPARKPFRRDSAAFVAAVRDLCRARPDILVLHESPALPGDPSGQWKGSPAVCEALTGFPKPLVFSGHCRWSEPLGRIQDGPMVANLDSRVLVLTASPSRPPAPALAERTGTLRRDAR